jgi:hypothetical protein
VDCLPACAVPHPHGPVLAQATATAAKPHTDDYIKHAAGRSTAQEIADAKALLDSGSVTTDEFETLKA